MYPSDPSLNAAKKIKGNGNVVTVQREVGSYEGLAVGAFYEVVSVAGAEGDIILEGGFKSRGMGVKTKVKPLKKNGL